LAKSEISDVIQKLNCLRIRGVIELNLNVGSIDLSVLLLILVVSVNTLDAKLFLHGVGL
jgi:hypothetical protein